ncbi:hypothetical protein [Yoonia sp.]|uniref:hypothetical protein n=1 Tax=Yoonia sp. TaxID=2212373 RepID=UPI0025FAC23E|nr:hypothetical protein [Yoonia sp.]
MPVVTLPFDTSERLKDRIQHLEKTQKIKLFPATDVVMALVFTAAETKEFGGDEGAAMVLAIDDLAALGDIIPEIEDGRRNYCIIRNDRAIARLDPFH